MKLIFLITLFRKTKMILEFLVHYQKSLISGTWYSTKEEKELLESHARVTFVCSLTVILRNKEMATPRTTLSVEDGVAIITLDNPPVNALHPNGTVQ